MPASSLKKRIVIIPAWYPSSDAPLPGLFVRDQAECLAQKYDVSVLTPRLLTVRSLGRTPLGPRITRRIVQGIDEWEIRQWVPPSLSSVPPFRAWLRPPNRAAKQARYFFKAVRHGLKHYLASYGRPALVHAHVVVPAGWTAATLALPHGIPTVLTEHSGPFYYRVRTQAERELAGQALANIDHVLAVSPFLRDDMHAFFPNRAVEVLGNVVRTDLFTPGSEERRPGPFRFLCLATLEPAKGVQFLLDAARRLVQDGIAFELVIAGDGPQRAELERLALASKLTSHCRFIGRLTREQAREQMQQCDALVHPSLIETFGIVLGEAMACGKPVVATRCGGPSFVVSEHGGVLVAPGDAAELARGMQTVMQNAASFDAGRIRQTVVERFGPEAFLRNLEEKYEAVLDRRRLRRAS